VRAFEYTRASTIDEALSGLRQDGQVRALAGGTDLLPLMKADVFVPARLIDVKRVAGLGGGVVDRGADGISIGALTSLATLEQHGLLRERYTALSEAAALAATPQLRNMATLGGNLLQRPRCWYYRDSLFHCWLKGGEICQAREGENQNHAIFQQSPCVAVHASDPATALLALDARVSLRGPDGEARVLPVAEFFTLPSEGHRQETAIRADELIQSIDLPPLDGGTRTAYVKAMNRKVWAFALVSVAAALRVEAGRIVHARLVLGGVAPVPWRVHAAEEVLVGAEPDEPLFERAAAAALGQAEPLAKNRYKLTLAHGLIRQVLRRLLTEG
jgi:xanthine dehydrogenase YagS FAD-binding subunit